MWQERRSTNRPERRSIDDHRSPYERDNTRIIHSPAFRRLQRKTQILGSNEGDFHRTRLTHSLEVASIAKSLVRNLKRRVPLKEILPCDDLISAISLLHDIGHPPFGHGGEIALNYVMRAHGGFEGNGQTLRLITKLENSYGSYGLDLTRRTLLGILKYPVPYSKLVTREPSSNPDRLKLKEWHPPKCYLDSEQDVVDWILAPFSTHDSLTFQEIAFSTAASKHGHTKYQSLDCSLMNIADDIAYGVHDLEDAIHLQLISQHALENEEVKAIYEQANEQGSLPLFESMMDKLFDPAVAIRKSAIGELVNFFITSTMLTECGESVCFESPLLKYNASLPTQAQALLSAFKHIIYRHVIDSPEARSIEFGGQTVVVRLFDAISTNAESLLDLNYREKYRQAATAHEAMRVVCDYIANMTDEYAYRMHERLFGFNTRTVFERFS